MKSRSALVSESVAWVTWKVNFVSEIPVSLVPAPIHGTGASSGGRSMLSQNSASLSVSSARSRLPEADVVALVSVARAHGGAHVFCLAGFLDDDDLIRHAGLVQGILVEVRVQNV